MLPFQRLWLLVGFLPLTLALQAQSAPLSLDNERNEAANKGERTDLYGDPLPRGALARFGTVRLRGESPQAFSFSADGKVLISGNYTGTTFWDARTGKPLRRVVASDPEFYRTTCTAFSPDGRIFAIALARGDFPIWMMSRSQLKVASSS
jgi:hypothetical protein